MDRRSGDGVVHWSEIALTPEHDVGGVLDLHQAPVVAHAELSDDGAVALGKPIQRPVQRSDGKPVGDLLRRVEVVDLHERVVEQFVADAGFVELARQPVMAVEVEL